ncbi:MAG: DUF4321 domain-containing protein [candidate division KSB1 bacterium]|nr:DUF4321 domain-containing protein [candidate division KSB1 bacterium]MDZ7303134.1 DUF4321 domain-containing protein [candidate division KSB1 bacterium]MDZ7310115.1 DUF4321 domain-containing protein [candidate division KSB1 bacterium]
MRSKRSLGFIIVVLLLGALAGTLLGELIGLLLPAGVVKEFFLRSGQIALGPGTLNAVLFSITLGLTLKINVVGLIGIGIAAYLLRWVLN